VLAAAVPRMRLFAVAVAVLLGASGARALPDLAVQVYDVHVATDQTVEAGDVAEGCAPTTTGRTLVRFGMRTLNVGAEDLALGDPGCPDCTAHPAEVCADPLFFCSPAGGHMHPHFQTFSHFELLDLAGNVVASSAKRGFCFRDNVCPAGVAKKYDCDHQGITVGCYDDYTPDLGCQYLDVTDVPDVTRRAFALRVTIDAANLLPDATRANDVTVVPIPGCGDGVLQPGEDCDPGPGGAPCCDDQCRFRPAGATCRPAAGACDAVETCDGGSAACPADAVLPDGTPCGAGLAGCGEATCTAGACVAPPTSGTCVVGGACVAAGRLDPADACAVCDPIRNGGDWSPNVAADANGIQCQLARVASAVAAAACTPRAARAVGRPLGQLRHRVERLLAASRHGPRPRRVLAAAKHLSRILARTRRRGCTTDDADAALRVLAGQLRALPRPSSGD